LANWVTLTEAQGIASNYPLTIPTDFELWINLAQLRLESDFRYNFPTIPTDKMKTALVLYATDLPKNNANELLVNGVQSFSIGKFSQSFSDEATLNNWRYSQTVEALLREYRVGRQTVANLKRRLPSN
jgi:hypothetical protein